MKTFIQPGKVVTVPAPSGGVVSGQGVLVGALFGIATRAAAEAAPVELLLEGVVDINKVGSQAWTVGALVYWDAGNARATTVAASNLLIGVAVEAVGSGSGETTGRIRLNAAFRPAEPA